MLNFVSLVTLLLYIAVPTTAKADATAPRHPITLSRTGGFNIGGKIIPHPSLPGDTLSCDHGYLEYFIPYHPRRTNLVMWHSSSTQIWQNRFDGGPGFKDLFLQRSYPVWLWDGPRVGRAFWPCEPTSYNPYVTSDQANFVGWNFGPRYKEWWPGSKFPTENETAWQQATSNRYVEYDTPANVELQSDAAAIAADSGKIGDKIVYVTNSAGGLRAQVTATKANATNIKGIIMYESIGYVFPDNANVTAGTGPFGPIVVPLKRFKKLAEVTAIQFIWGDYSDERSTEQVEYSKLCASLINQYGGNAEVVRLGGIKGFEGNTHMPFADLNNEKVADLLEGFFRRNGLDKY